MVTKKCEECGKLYLAMNSKQRFCRGPHWYKCEVCGKLFEYSCSPSDKPHTCSKECKYKYMKQNLQSKYGVDNVSQIPDVIAKKHISNSSEESLSKRRETCLQRYGVDNTNQLDSVKRKISEKLKSEEVQAKRRKTFQSHYGYDHCFSSPEFREKHKINDLPKLESTKSAVRKTLLEKYGVTNISNIPEVKAKASITRAETCVQRYGQNCIFKTSEFKAHIQDQYHVDNVMKNSEVMRKAMRNKQHKSNLEVRLHNFLNTYNIEYIEEYVIKDDSMIHSFDVYLPKYNILIDCDGDYWHSYLSDPDGGRVRDDGDAVRLALVPSDAIFYLIVESDFERGLRGLQRIIKEIDKNLFDYDSELFNWCRNIGFPYPDYGKDRLLSDWHKLQMFDACEYNENRTLGISSINQFHKSIYDAYTHGCISPRQAWEDDSLLKKVIANRLIYINNVDPSKVLKGFSISKVATRVSVFNPTLAKYICQKYIKDFSEVVDPFSGFSGRLLGCCAAGKSYYGRDLSKSHVSESNEIIKFLNLQNCEVIQQDILAKRDETFECLLTCPPYSNKEIYDAETEFKSCEDWITECLDRFKCNRYLFVVDDAGKYKNCIVEELKARSHFRKCSEYVVCIDANNLK